MNGSDQKRDNIDSELLRTYFGGGNKNQTEAPVDKPSRSSASSSGSPLKWGIILTGVVIAVLLVIRFMPGNLTEQPSPQAGPKYTSSLPVPSAAIVEEKVFYDFEDGEDGWDIPGWAVDKPDHVASEAVASEDTASRGDKSLKVVADFPDNTWTAAIVEIQHFLDLDGYDLISADLYLPPDAPTGLRGKIILTMGEDWKFVEMARSIRLEPGEWTNITASLKDNSIDWKRTRINEASRSDIRKIAVRVESDKRPAYSGAVYIDNIRAGKLAP
jgi:hypothetical protein